MRLRFGIGESGRRARRLTATLCCASVIAACSDASSPAFDVTTATVADVQSALRDGRVTCREIARQVRSRIAAVDDAGPRLNAVLETNPDLDVAAAALDAAYAASGPVGPLHCVPLAVKDNYGTGDRMRTTAASLTMGDFTAPEDAFSIAKLRAAGALLIAKVNMDEFAFGATGYSSRGGQTVDAYLGNRIPGGSSGASAVAVASGMAVIATGSDTAGSIRIPAALNSTVGVKPTLGLIGRTGIVPASEYLDVGGPIARTVTDAALMLGAMTGIDPGDDATKASAGRSYDDYTPFLDASGLDGARVGVLRSALDEPLSGQNADVDAAFAASLDTMAARGAILGDTVLPPVLVGEEVVATLGAFVNGEFPRELDAYLATTGRDAPLRDARDLLAAASALGPEVVKNLSTMRSAIESPPATDAELDAALALRARLRDALVAIMDDANVEALTFPTLLCPATPLPGVVDPGYLCASAPPMPFSFGQAFGGEPIILASLAGLPEITVPAGYTADGAPIGISFFGRAFSEPTLLRLAYAYEQATLARRAPGY